jgi:hypothetical protein
MNGVKGYERKTKEQLSIFETFDWVIRSPSFSFIYPVCRINIIIRTVQSPHFTVAEEPFQSCTVRRDNVSVNTIFQKFIKPARVPHYQKCNFLPYKENTKIATTSPPQSSIQLSLPHVGGTTDSWYSNYQACPQKPWLIEQDENYCSAIGVESSRI